jgi:hypothetical protein
MQKNHVQTDSISRSPLSEQIPVDITSEDLESSEDILKKPSSVPYNELLDTPSQPRDQFPPYSMQPLSIQQLTQPTYTSNHHDRMQSPQSSVYAYPSFQNPTQRSLDISPTGPYQLASPNNFGTVPNACMHWPHFHR